MRKPGAAAYLFGNPVVMLASLAALGWFGWQTLQGAGDGPAILAIAALITAAWGGKASERIHTYKAWKREWALMGGEPDPRRIEVRNFRFLHRLVGTAVLGGILWYVTVTPGMEAFAAYFWLATLFLIGFAIVWSLRKRGATRKMARAAASPMQQPLVALCLAVPRTSPDFPTMHNALPEHCWPLFRT